MGFVSPLEGIPPSKNLQTYTLLLHREMGSVVSFEDFGEVACLLPYCS